ncbi:MAG: hypothetical protein HY918_02650 [Candidatus Doudnabacteria bacterium]|nr:hypothetical protein [Candidatus Doudnabacteria bacterium]
MTPERQGYNPAEAQETQLKKIKTMHLLVHPGYNLDKDSQAKMAPEQREYFLGLLETFEEMAAHVKAQGEFMLIACHKNKAEFNEDQKLHKPYAKFLGKIEKQLEKQGLIFFNNDKDLDFTHVKTDTEEGREALQEIQDSYARLVKLINKQGYELDSNSTDVLIYGEDLASCIHEVGAGLHQAGNFKKKFTVLTGYTDALERADDLKKEPYPEFQYQDSL